MELPIFLAQAQLPIAGDGVDYALLIQNLADSFVDQHVGLLEGLGLAWLAALAPLQIAKIAVLQYFSKTEFDPIPFGIVLFKWVMLTLAITYWSTPIFGTGVSVHQIISTEMTYIAGTIDMTVVGELTATLDAVKGAMEIPGLLNIFGSFIYMLALFLLGMIYFLSFGVTVMSYPLLGIGYLLGPLLIVWFIWPSLSWVAWGFVRFILIYSMARVAAMSLVWVWAHAIAWFFANVMGVGDHKIPLGEILTNAPYLGALAAGFAVSLFQVYAVGRDIFHGTASSGSVVSSGVAAARMAALAFA